MCPPPTRRNAPCVVSFLAVLSSLPPYLPPRPSLHALHFIPDADADDSGRSPRRTRARSHFLTTPSPARLPVTVSPLRSRSSSCRMYRAKRAASLRAKRQRLGKYELGCTIGEGTFAKVRIAKNMDTGDHVAIKILDKAKVHKNKLAEQEGNLYDEANTTSQCCSPVRGDGKLKGKCALRPFLSILVIEYQHKCLNVNQYP
ncbi:CBL-interacting serine/threonine-protein kinase 18 isoform X2 [Zea mays]|uniref:CBL-interacting serine/threonine-protein kinase 18 isoform X2 n=1 Tax=Zea mays TaxID=4577 RepID=UPI0016527943|nr:CBL-interacting serine/threonine-protein kinase 18 isoform X2 [Zea mays]